MKKLPKDIQELLDNTPKMSKKSWKQLKKAAEELKNDSEFQKEVEEGIRENAEISKDVVCDSFNSSVKERIKDNNSKIKLTPFNCNEAKFGKIVVMPNPYCPDGKFEIVFRRNSTSEKFFESIDKQFPNQILWNEEEQQAYFLNSDKQLYKILFESFIMNTEKLEEIRLRKEIENIAIPWSKFRVDGCHYRNILNVHLLKPLFIDLLGLVKERMIIVRCGVGMMQIINENFNIINREGWYSFAGCEIIAELDFNIAKFDMVYDDICIVGKGVLEKETPDNGSEYFNKALKEVAEEVCPPKKNIWLRIFG
jgi:hypothetical protein